METLWFCLVAAMLTTYVVLDGFDLGAGILHLFIAKTPEERSTVIRTVGPVWDGNEVWLIASGGTLFAVFPVLYATAFSGFYLPLAGREMPNLSVSSNPPIACSLIWWKGLMLS